MRWRHDLLMASLGAMCVPAAYFLCGLLTEGPLHNRFVR